MEARIKKYYGLSSVIIYPPVDTNKFTVHSSQFTGKELLKDYFLVVSRLVSGKRIDLIIDAFNMLRLPLVIIGRGKMQRELVKRAKGNIRFISRYLTDEELVRYYGNCRALIHAADEDFGIAAVEAQSCGKPVIAYRYSGISEIVHEGVTGLFFLSQSSDAIVQAIQKFMTMTFLERDCTNNAKRFSLKRFQSEMKETIEHLYQQYQASYI